MKRLYHIVLFALWLTGPIVPVAAQSTHTYGHADNVAMDFKKRYILSFQTDTPQVIHKPFDLNVLIGANESFGVYSDQNGNLKLYSNGCHIWNGNHQQLNTANIYCDTICQASDYHAPFSVNDSMGNHLVNTAIPMPGNPDLIYVFTLHPARTGPYLNEIFYSIVDISVTPGQIVTSGQVFYDFGQPTAPDMVATKHANGRDYWLVTRKLYDNTWVAFHIQPSGHVDTVHSPNTGLIPELYTGSWLGGHYRMQISPNGRILADQVMGDTIQLLHFNAETGVVSDSNARYIIDYGFWLVPRQPVFSPDNSKLYVYHHAIQRQFTQYDLNTNTQAELLNSRTILFAGHVFDKNWGRMFLAANGKIYNPALDLDFGNPGAAAPKYFNTIEYPNLPDTNSQWSTFTFLLDTIGRSNQTRSTNFCSSWLKEPLDFSYSHVCAGEGTPPTHFAFTDSVVDAFWSFGDTLAMGADTSNLFFPTYHYNQPGDYHVWAKALSYGMWDSISKVITIHPPAQVALGPDTVLTGNDSLVLDAGPDHISYNWSTGDSTRTITLYGNQLSPGDYMYFVEVTDTNGCTGTGSIMVTYEEDTTSIVQKAREPLWEVFPNPCEDNLHIKFTQSMPSGQTYLRLYSPEGKLLQKWDVPAHTHRFTVDMSAYSSGIYWLELSTGDKVRREKIVKVNHP